jgi:hypothetical protein
MLTASCVKLNLSARFLAARRRDVTARNRRPRTGGHTHLQQAVPGGARLTPQTGGTDPRGVLKTLGLVLVSQNKIGA